MGGMEKEKLSTEAIFDMVWCNDTISCANRMVGHLLRSIQDIDSLEHAMSNLSK